MPSLSPLPRPPLPNKYCADTKACLYSHRHIEAIQRASGENPIRPRVVPKTSASCLHRLRREIPQVHVVPADHLAPHAAHANSEARIRFPLPGQVPPQHAKVVDSAKGKSRILSWRQMTTRPLASS